MFVFIEKAAPLEVRSASSNGSLEGKQKRGLRGLSHIREVNSHYRKTRRNKRKCLKSPNASSVRRGMTVCENQHVDSEKTTADGLMAGTLEVMTTLLSFLSNGPKFGFQHHIAS